MAHIAHLLGKPADAAMWDKRALRRDAAIHRYLWWPREGVFADYNFMRGLPSEYAYITSLYPLWAGVATREEAQQVVAKLDLFERPGGLSMSDTDTGLQWDEPFGWAPTNWIGIDGLERAGFHADAARLARKWNHTVDVGFAEEGTIREKYNVDAANADVHVVTGYKQNQIGFGWTNAVYLKMLGIEQRQAAMAKAANQVPAH